MDQNPETTEKQAQYVMADEAESRLLDGFTKTYRKDLLKGEHLEINEIIIRGSGDGEDFGVSGIIRTQYVLHGEATLRRGAITTGISQGQLIIVPPGVPWGPGLSVASDQFTLLDIAPRVRSQSAVPPSDAKNNDSIRIIKPEDVPSYPPAGHFNTTNRCLYLDENIEIIEGLIESGGGAERHFHREHEQILYVLESNAPLLIYYPKGTPHGTQGGMSERLKLLVIYSPPLGESRNALG